MSESNQYTSVPKQHKKKLKKVFMLAKLDNAKAARRLDELVKKSETQNTSNNNSKPFKDFHTLLDK